MDKIIEIIMGKVLHILHIKIENSKFKNLIQFISFGVIGISNTIIGYLLNIIVIIILKPYFVSWDYIVANMIAFLIGVLWSFYWNNKYVFVITDGHERNLGIALLKTYISYGFTGIILNNLLSYIWIYIFGVSKMIAPLINMIISVPINFLINKLWAFKASKS